MDFEDALLLGLASSLVGLMAWILLRTVGRFALARAPAPGRHAMRRRLALGLGAWLGLLGLDLGSCQWLASPQKSEERPRPRILHCYHRTFRDRQDGPRRGWDRGGDNGGNDQQKRLLYPDPARPRQGGKGAPHCWLHPRVLEKARSLAERGAQA